MKYWIMLNLFYLKMKDTIPLMEFVQVNSIISSANSYLTNLDNGGFIVEDVDAPVSINKSDTKFGKTYVDRLDGNKTKHVSENKKSMLAMYFSF